MENPLIHEINLDKYLNEFSALKITILKEKKILIVSLNRPKQLNALNETIFIEIAN